MLDAPQGAPGAGPEADPPPPHVLRLRLSADPEAPRLHLQHGRVQAHGGPAGPFFRTLAEELVGTTLRRLEQVGGDRIALLEFHDPPAGARRALVVELVGRHANLVLLGPGDGVLAVLVPPPARPGATPRLGLGRPWCAPGGGARGPEREAPPLAQVFPEPDAPPPGDDPGRAPLSWRVEVVLGTQAAQARRAHLARRLAQRLARRRERARSRVAGLEERLRACAGAQRVRQDGELLKAKLGELARGADSVELVDWFTEGSPARRIPLDPRRSPRENVERLFARYRKLQRSQAGVGGELDLARRHLAALEDLAARARQPDADPRALEAQARSQGLLGPPQEGDPRKRAVPPPRLPYRVFRVHGDAEVWVGRSARDNDRLTFRHARGNDLWLHTADCPGSHVVLRVERGREPHPEALVDAALLAVHFSPARGGDPVPVHLARCKEVRKPRGAKPGLVTLSGGRILRVRAQQERLERLLRSARGRATPP